MSYESKATHNNSLTVKALLIVFTIIFLIPAAASAQTFSAGSLETDGALSFTCAEGGETIVWDPSGIDANGDRVFDFTTITVPADCTIKFTFEKLGPRPILSSFCNHPWAGGLS